MVIPLFCVAQHSRKNESALNLNKAGSSDSLVIIYSANLNGNIDNCGCGDPPLGGLDHFAGILQRERQKSFTVFLDGGDAFNAYSYPELNNALVRIYRLLRPDVITIADQEFSEGRRFLLEALPRMAADVVLGNIRFPGYDKAKAFRRFRHQKHVLGVTSYLELRNRHMGSVRGFLHEDDQRFEKAVKAIDDADYKVLIYHGERKFLPALLRKYPHWDLVLLAHEQLAVNEMQGPVRLVCPGADGEYASRIVLKMAAGKKNIVVQQIPVGLEWPADPDIKKIIKSYQH